jgi:CBS domain-containing protein
MKTLRQLIEGKSKKLASIAPDQTVLEALKVMAEYDVGALLVLNGKRLAGIFSERDYARRIMLHDRSSAKTKVSEVMTEKVLYVTLQNTIEQCMAIMTDKHVRHLPVLDDAQEVIGVVSIGDVVKETISQQQFIISQMERYITGDR